jgi:hypothetical protein
VGWGGVVVMASCQVRPQYLCAPKVGPSIDRCPQSNPYSKLARSVYQPVPCSMAVLVAGDCVTPSGAGAHGKRAAHHGSWNVFEHCPECGKAGVVGGRQWVSEWDWIGPSAAHGSGWRGVVRAAAALAGSMQHSFGLPGEHHTHGHGTGRPFTKPGAQHSLLLLYSSHKGGGSCWLAAAALAWVGGGAHTMCGAGALQALVLSLFLLECNSSQAFGTVLTVVFWQARRVRPTPATREAGWWVSLLLHCSPDHMWRPCVLVDPSYPVTQSERVKCWGLACRGEGGKARMLTISQSTGSGGCGGRSGVLPGWNRQQDCNGFCWWGQPLTSALLFAATAVSAHDSTHAAAAAAAAAARRSSACMPPT